MWRCRRSGRRSTRRQTALNLIAVGYSLGLAASVLYFGALGDRYGRKLMLIARHGSRRSRPACSPPGRPRDEVLFGARVLGGLSAGMAYPTTLALITALWAGPGRTKSIALWSGIGGAISALGPVLVRRVARGVLVGLGLPDHAAARGGGAGDGVPLRAESCQRGDRPRRQPRRGPVGRAGRQRSCWRSTSPPVPSSGALTLGLAAIAVAALVAFLIRQRRAANPLYDLAVAGRRVFWVAACAGVIVFGTLMGAMFIGQQFLQNVLGYSTFEAGLSILPAAALMVLVAPRSAKLVEARGRPGHAARRLRLLPARLPDDAAALERGHRVLEGRPRRTRSSGSASGSPARPPRTRSPARCR